MLIAVNEDSSTGNGFDGSVDPIANSEKELNDTTLSKFSPETIPPIFSQGSPELLLLSQTSLDGPLSVAKQTMNK